MMIKKTRANKSRSRNGCLTCRQRHIKCDEELPVCKNCRRSNRDCERGCRFNFLKSLTTTIEKNEDEDYSRIRYIDQSLSIHKLYRCNDFHDYSDWLRYHSKQELRESEADIREGETASDTPSRRRAAQVQQNQSQENSDSETSRQSSGTPVPFNTVEFVAKVLALGPPLMYGDTTMFIQNNQEPLLRYLSGTNVRPAVDDKVTLLDFASFFDRWEALGHVEAVFIAEFTVFLNSLSLCVKSGVIDLFSETFASSRVLTGIYDVSNIHNWSFSRQALSTYEKAHNQNNLMNLYELMLMDLNDSLKYNKPNSYRMDFEGSSYVLEKILATNLVDDLNYFLVRITTILLRLNNLRHHQHKSYPILMQIIRDLKDFENNQFLSAFFPVSHDDSSFSSASSSSSTVHRTSLHPKTSLGYSSLKARRIHIYYNFTLFYIHQHFSLTQNTKNIIYAPSLLNTFWNRQDSDIIQRLIQMSHDYDFSMDVFMSFVKR